MPRGQVSKTNYSWEKKDNRWCMHSLKLMGPKVRSQAGKLNINKFLEKWCNYVCSNFLLSNAMLCWSCFGNFILAFYYALGWQ